MMFLAQVTTSWVDLTPTHRGIRLEADHGLADWTDVTGQPAENITPIPNALTVEVICNQAMLDAMEADSNCVGLWSEEVVETPQ